MTQRTHLIKSWATTQTVIAMSSGEGGIAMASWRERGGYCELASRLDWSPQQRPCLHGLKCGSRHCDALGRREGTAP